MKRPSVTADRFKAVWAQTGGSPTEVARILGYAGITAVCNRRAKIEKVEGIKLSSSSHKSGRTAEMRRKNSRRIDIKMENGTILVGSDAHVWPGPLTTAQRGFIALAKRLKPTMIVANGDVFDGAKVSRHPPGMWSDKKPPGPNQELEACSAFLGPLKQVCELLYWMLGNHDMRYEARLAALVPEYEGVPGFALKDHFPEWTFGMAMFVNDNLVIKHRYANGIHAAHNNAVKSGRSIVTGHLHSLKITPWTDYNGTRYGVDCGTLSDPDGPQFDYGEENPANHRAGFVLLTIKGGKLLMPELCQVWDEDHVEFRGELIPV